MKTKQQAINKIKAWSNTNNNGGYVYQYPAGHWDCCSFRSPVGKNIENFGKIYRQEESGFDAVPTQVFKVLGINGTYSIQPIEQEAQNA